MALVIDPASANIRWTTTGAKAGAHPGKEFAVLHCTQNANLAAGNTNPAGRVDQGSAVTMEASVFLAGGAADVDLGDRQFGMVQVTEIFFYEFLYAGRLASDGSCVLDMKKGFATNPCLDVNPSRGETIDQHIFDSANMNTTLVKTGRTGIQVKVRFGDHPNNVIPWRFENRETGSPNFLVRASRGQQFIVYFVTRENASGPVTILGRLGWTLAWRVSFKWKSLQDPPTASLDGSDLFAGEFRAGAPNPLDPFATIAVNRSGATAPAQDAAAVEAIFTRRQRPQCEQNKARPGFQGDLF